MSFQAISATTDKKAELFGFTESERFNILQQAEKAGFVWNTANMSSGANHPRQLEQLKKKEVNLTLHASTLTEYLKAKRIPRGLRSNLTPMLLKEDKIYKQRWEALCNQNSLDLMFLTVQHLQKAALDVKQEIIKVDVEFKTNSSASDYNRTHYKLKTNMEKLKNQIMMMKLKKFEPDTRDYQFDRVYT